MIANQRVEMSEKVIYEKSLQIGNLERHSITMDNVIDYLEGQNTTKDARITALEGQVTVFQGQITVFQGQMTMMMQYIAAHP